MKSTPSILEQHDYTWLDMPRDGINVYDLIEDRERGIFRRLFSKSTGTVVNASVQSLFPDIKLEEAKNINFPQSFKGEDILDIGAGVKVNLDGLQQLGKGKAGVDFKSAKKLLYSFKKAQLKSANKVALSIALERAKPDSSGEYLDKMKDGKIYIITDTFICRNFCIEEVVNLTIDGEISADLIKSILNADGTLKAQYQSATNNKIEAKGKDDIVFAIKAFRIEYRKNKYGIGAETLRIVKNSGNPSGFEDDDLTGSIILNDDSE